MKANELAQKFHEAYRRVSPKFYGTTAQSPSWEEIPDKSREHLIAVCREVLGEPFEAQEIPVEKVPPVEEFERAKATAPEETRDALSDWEGDLRQQIDRAVTPARIRKAFIDVEEPFKK